MTMLAFLRFETVRTLRNVRFLVFIVAFPVGLYLIYGRGAGSGSVDGLTGATYLLVSMALYSAMGAGMYASGPLLSAERASGWLRQLRIWPLSAQSWLAVKLGQGLLLAVPGAAAVALVALGYGKVQLGAGRWLALAGVAVLAALLFGFVGMVLGLSCRPRTAQPAQVVTLMTMAMLGGVFIPWSQLPTGVQRVGEMLPAYHVTEVARLAVGVRPLGLVHPLVLAGWVLLLGVAVLVLWRRETTAG
jgi:ABC-2 type transport system permease protein